MSKLILICLAFVSTILAHPDYSETFEEFKAKYNKNYDSEMEEVKNIVLWFTIFCTSRFKKFFQ